MKRAALATKTRKTVTRRGPGAAPVMGIASLASMVDGTSAEFESKFGVRLVRAMANGVVRRCVTLAHCRAPRRRGPR